MPRPGAWWLTAALALLPAAGAAQGSLSPSAAASPPLSSIRAAGDLDHDLVIAAVPLAPGVVADIHVRVVVDEAAPCDGRSAFAIHGAAHNAASWGPFAEALFDDRTRDARTCRFYAIDLPGHGASGWPSGAGLGDLRIEHYAAAVRGTLEALASQGVRPRSIIGHSMGGLIIQQLQTDLIADGSDLGARFGIRDAILIASSLPALELDEDCAATAGPAPSWVWPWPALPGIAYLPDPIWRALFFSDSTGAVVDGAPDLFEVARYNALESLAALGQVVAGGDDGAPTLPPALFDRGRTRLTVLAHHDDWLARSDEQRCLHRYLSADAADDGFVVHLGPGAVHDAHVSSPADVVGALRSRNSLP